MSNFASLADAIEKVAFEHKSSFGQSPRVVAHLRDERRRLLWSSEDIILRALRIAATAAPATLVTE